MGEERNWKRIRERLRLNLPIRVHCRETKEFEWTETSRLTDVTPFGAGFTLKHPTEPGRLLHMTIPMPRQLRVFDHLELQYKIWGLVRHAKPVTTPNTDNVRFEVGVAFIGKRPPPTHDTEPWRRYESRLPPRNIPGVAEKVRPITQTDQRQFTRHNIAVDLRLETFDDTGEPVMSEMTVTEDISKRGARIFTTIPTQIGRFIRLTSAHYEMTTFAAIRGLSTGQDGIGRIHVEFIDKEWPL